MATTQSIGKDTWAVCVLGVYAGIVRLVRGSYLGYKGARYETLAQASLSFS